MCAARARAGIARDRERPAPPTRGRGYCDFWNAPVLAWKRNAAQAESGRAVVKMEHGLVSALSGALLWLNLSLRFFTDRCASINHSHAVGR